MAGDPDVFIVPIDTGVELQDTDGDPVDPTEFFMTMPDGTLYDITQGPGPGTGLQSITDRVGNVAFFDRDSSGSLTGKFPS
jgi:hypothetical protein